MKGLALATIGLWVILQTTYGPLATKLGLITGGSSSAPPLAGGGKPVGPFPPVPSTVLPPSTGGGPTGGASPGPGGSNTGNA